MADKADKGKADENKKEPPTKKPNLLNEKQVILAESGNHYLVEQMLGKGGFGEVFKVSLVSDPEKKYAMKVEPVKVDKKHEEMMRLKVELHVFSTIAATPDSKVDKTHFVKMHDKGRTAKFKYYVMDLISMSLQDVVIGVLKWKISPSTMIKIARQTLKGIETLHELGFLHRDIKSANYAVGLPPKDNIIYLMDFGIARPYKDRKGRLMLPRATVKFLGTVRYASIRSLQKEDQSRKDDLEVWMYMMLELYDKKNLWWREFDQRDGWDEYVKRTIGAKNDLRLRARVMYLTNGLQIPELFCEIIDTIHKMKYNDAGNFKYLNAQLDAIVEAEKINEATPLDWIGKIPVPEEPKKSEAEEKKSPEELKKNEVKKDQKMEKAKDENKKDYKSDKKRGKSETKLRIQTMEDIKEELRRDKKRRSKPRRTEDEYSNYDDEDSEDDDYSDEDEEEYRRRRKRGRKRRPREKLRTREYSDRSDREETDERDERGDRRRRRRKSPGGKKRTRASRKRTYEEKDLDIPKIPEPKEADEEKERDRKRSKGERTVEANEKTVDVEQRKKRNGKTPEVEKDANVKRDTDKKDGDIKKEQKSPVVKPDQDKEVKEAPPVKRDPDLKK